MTMNDHLAQRERRADHFISHSPGSTEPMQAPIAHPKVGIDASLTVTNAVAICEITVQNPNERSHRVTSIGVSKRHPDDLPSATIGGDLALSRAFANLAEHYAAKAAEGMERAAAHAAATRPAKPNRPQKEKDPYFYRLDSILRTIQAGPDRGQSTEAHAVDIHGRLMSIITDVEKMEPGPYVDALTAQIKAVSTEVMIHVFGFTKENAIKLDEAVAATVTSSNEREALRHKIASLTTEPAAGAPVEPIQP